MDRATNSTAPADRVFCAVELSKNSWLLGIQFPDRQKASVYPSKGTRKAMTSKSCRSEGGTTAGEFPRKLCGRSLIDARPQTGIAPDEKTEMRYPTRASEIVH